MTKKKSIISLILAICLMLPAMFMMTACGGKPISEKGKTYSVKDKQSDITIKWGDDKDTLLEELGSEETAKNGFASFSITFNENGTLTISFTGNTDKERYYAINENNCIEFYDSAEDAEKRINKITDEYLGAEYKFSSNKKTISITEQVSPKTSVVIKLSVNA